MAASKKDAAPVPAPEAGPVCACCKRELPKPALPVYCDGECYCPACFVYRIAPASNGRFHPEGFLAVQCPTCGAEAVITKGSRCPNCRWRILNVLPLPVK